MSSIIPSLAYLSVASYFFYRAATVFKEYVSENYPQWTDETKKTDDEPDNDETEEEDDLIIHSKKN